MEKTNKRRKPREVLALFIEVLSSVDFYVLIQIKAIRPESKDDEPGTETHQGRKPQCLARAAQGKQEPHPQGNLSSPCILGVMNFITPDLFLPKDKI